MIDPAHAPYLGEAMHEARHTHGLAVGPGTLRNVARLFVHHFRHREAVVVADTNTFRAAGQTVFDTFRAAGRAIRDPFVFSGSELVAEETRVAELEAAFGAHAAVPIAVGAGTINDLVKLAAHRAGRSYLCVATAASMDGYTAVGASIARGGTKQTLFCHAPSAVLADLDVIRAAPAPMRAWGYADLVAKVTAGADWIVADALGVERIQPHAWRVVQGHLRELIADPAGIRARDESAVGRLMQGLLLGGFAMQAVRSSRPASGAEHHFSHLWDMQQHTHGGHAVPHGFKVAIGTLAVTALYERLLELMPSRLDVLGLCAAWPERRPWLRRVRELLGAGPVAELGVRESRAKHSGEAELRAQLETLHACWPALRERLRAQLLPFAALREMLRTAGAPVEPEEIGISRSRLRASYWQALCIRRRFTVLDLALRTALLEPCLDRIFGADGPWPERG